MCTLLLDAAVLCGLVMFLNQDSDSPGYGKAVLAALGIGLLTFVAGMLLQPLGLVALAIIIPAAAAIAGGVLWVVFDVPPLKAAIGGGVYLVYKIAISVLFAMMFAR